jgi:predicted membrane protein
MSTVTSPARISGKTLVGVALVLLGILFTLDNFGIVEARYVFRLWPVAIAAVGVVTWTRARLPEQRVLAGIIFLFGAALLLRNLDVLSFRLRIRELWPLVFIVGGGFLVFGSMRSRERSRERAAGGIEGAGTSDHRLNAFAVMGGGERIVRDDDFQGGEVTAILGGFEIDLRQAAIARDTADIEIFTLWGGVDLKVPEDWNVVVEAVPILGGFSNSTRSGSTTSSGGPRKTLVVRGTVIMGGVEIKN